ncbi:YggS family pyridoxal phosphate-dependent enzyme [soil metagenome]
MQAAIGERLAVVHDRVRAAGGDPAKIRLVAVTKGFSVDVVRSAVAAGLVEVGESYAQELEAKAADVDGARWHFVGRIQRNKVRRVAPLVALWHGVDRLVAGAEIARRSPGAAVLVQVDVSGEPQKGGCAWDDVPRLVDELGGLDLDVRGLMAVGPRGPAERSRPAFRRVVLLAERLGLPERSLGMSGDLEVAVQEGATTVRIGTALFGPRAPVEGVGH